MIKSIDEKMKQVDLVMQKAYCLEQVVESLAKQLHEIFAQIQKMQGQLGIKTDDT